MKKKTIITEFPTSIKLGLGSGSESGSASKWKVGSVSATKWIRLGIETVQIHNTGF
jgi:hypothetical protein